MGYTPKNGVTTELIEFESAGRDVQGCLFAPDLNRFRATTTAVVMVHGVEAYWHAAPTMFLGCLLAEEGYTVLGYNGVHSGESFRTSEFETAVQEVGDTIAFMKTRGFDNIFLLGHSLGTPMVEHYQGDRPDNAVKALGVYGPHINIPQVTRDSLLGPELYATFRAECRALVAAGKGDEIKLLPFREGRVVITSAKTFLSYRDVETSKANIEPMIRNIKVPFLIVYDSGDNIQSKGSVTTRESIALRIKENAVNSRKADVLVIPSSPGNSPFQAHLFVNNEKLVTQKTVEWLKSVGLTPTAR
ncbi:MAG: alpha/beta hydrolase [Deltaproteobacteria bacterium]|nr:alpha/beta hydrolase [Deltaproteobacteria bacterium]MBM4296140.1 alpha/beta hydrolase [Deltaproteobacteria bacterium]